MALVKINIKALVRQVYVRKGVHCHSNIRSYGIKSFEYNKVTRANKFLYGRRSAILIPFVVLHKLLHCAQSNVSYSAYLYFGKSFIQYP